MKRILVLGGGTGGCLIANHLAKQLSRREAEIVLITDSPYHVYQPGWLYVPFGWARPEALVRPLRGLLHRNIKVLIDPVSSLDPARRVVGTESGRNLDFDYLVVATGSHLAPEMVPGLEEASDHFYHEAAALKLQQKLMELRQGTVLIGIGGLPYKCPVAPLEFTFLLDDFLRRRNLRHQVKIRYTFPINAVFTLPAVAAMAERKFVEKGIEVETFFNLERMDPVRKIASSLEGSELPFDLAVFVPPHLGAKFLRGNPVADAEGWVQVDRATLQAKDFANIYALGDATALPISKAGSTAHFQGPVIAEHLAAAVRGTAAQGKHAAYDGHVQCFLEVGEDKAALLDFDYRTPPQPREPSTLVHYGKLAFNQAYWYLVPTAVV